MKLSHLVATISIAIAATSFSSVYAASHGSIDKVLGSASVASNEHYSDISLVNGSLKMASNSSAESISLVNGSIIGTKTGAQGVQNTLVVDGMNVAPDDSRQCPHMGSVIDIRRQ